MQSIKQRQQVETKFEEIDEVHKFFKFLHRHSKRLKKLLQLASERLDTSESAAFLTNLKQKKAKKQTLDVNKEI